MCIRDRSGIHKGVVLSRYVNAIKDWLRYQNGHSPKIQTETPLQRYGQTGIPAKMATTEPATDQERGATKLSLTPEYYPIMITLKDYLTKEIEIVGDKTINQEIELLDKIISTDHSS